MSNLVIEVSVDLERRLRDQAERRGLPMDVYLRAALEAMVADAGDPPTSGMPGSPLIALFEQVWEGIPDEEWDRLPADLAEQHDHYIHGLSKRTP